MRTGVLKLHDLTIKDFSSMEDAMKGADQLIAFQRQNQIAVEVWQQHPDEIVGDILLDRFWYCKDAGIRG